MQNPELEMYDLMRKCADKRKEELEQQEKKAHELNVRLLQSYLNGSSNYKDLPITIRDFIEKMIIAKEKAI